VCVQRVLALLLRNTSASSESGDLSGDSLRVRLARPGEFTLRAFLNGRLDLTQAEAVHGLVNARTNAAADGALAALRGGLAGPVKKARAEAVELLAELEARLDFDDELEPLDESTVAARTRRLHDAVSAVLETAERGRLRETGIVVALVGRPNAGKSSLLNAWSRSDKAIVTDVAGTTRDVVEASITVAGVPVTLLDTAGIRADTKGDVVEAIGVERSLAAASGADAVVLVVDARGGWAEEDREVWESLAGRTSLTKEETRDSRRDESEDASSTSSATSSPIEGSDEFENARARLYAVRGGLEHHELNDEDSTDDEKSGSFRLEASFADAYASSAFSASSATGVNGASARRAPMLLALNKIDAVPYVSSPVSEEEVSDAGELENWTKRAGVPEDVVASFDAVVATSATTRFGLSDLEEALASIIGAGSVNAEGAQWAANQRQAEALRCACAALDRLMETIKHGLPVDFWTIELREAAAALGEITGEDVAEDVLDVVFTKFCIGK
jgi:small GTP-binding protein